MCHSYDSVALAKDLILLKYSNIFIIVHLHHYYHYQTFINSELLKCYKSPSTDNYQTSQCVMSTKLCKELSVYFVTALQITVCFCRHVFQTGLKATAPNSRIRCIERRTLHTEQVNRLCTRCRRVTTPSLRSLQMSVSHLLQTDASKSCWQC